MKIMRERRKRAKNSRNTLGKIFNRESIGLLKLIFMIYREVFSTLGVDWKNQNDDFMSFVKNFTVNPGTSSQCGLFYANFPIFVMRKYSYFANFIIGEPFEPTLDVPKEISS